MAQDDFQSFVERVKQAESRGQRFDSKGNLLTSPKGAQGEMQVMPATQRDPGFGVAPVRDESPEEKARVGRDLLKAFDSKYGGNRLYAAAAYNWGPGNVDRWIASGADMSKLPKETQNYLQQVIPTATTATSSAPSPSAPASRSVAIGDSLAEGFAKANNLGGLYKSGAGPQAVMKMLQDYAASNSLRGMTVYLGTGLPNNPAQRDAVAQQVAFIKAQGGNPIVFGAGPGSQKNPTTGQNEFLQSVAQQTGAQFTGPLAQRFPSIAKQDPMGLHLTPTQYKELYKQTGGAPVTTAAPPAAQKTTAAPAEPAPVASAEDLGSGYKAALALAFLGDDDKDRQTSDDELRDRLDRQDEELQAQQETQAPANALQGLEIGALNPLKALRPPVQMADGGEVDGDTMYAQGNEAAGSAAPARFTAQEMMARINAANPGATVLEYVQGPGNAMGFVHSRMPDVINIKKGLTPGTREQTLLHELEHSMDVRGGDILSRPNVAEMDNNYRAYYLLNKDWRPIEKFVNSVVQNKDKLRDFFGQDIVSGYINMSPETLKKLKIRDNDRALFAEQIASLSALEQATGKSLTRDPEMRKLFPDTKMMAVYDALTGLRQTRTDARDLPPHTPLPSYTYETNPITRFIREKTTGPNEYGIPVKRADGSPETGEVSNSENKGFFSSLFKDSNDSFIKSVKENAEKNESYRDMQEYLRLRDAVPDVKTEYLPPGVDAAFSSIKLPLFGSVGTGTIKLNRELPAEPSWSSKKGIGPSTLTHEMAHAVDRQLEKQASEQGGIFSKGNKFTDAYEKMVGSEGMREGRRRTDLARKYYPEWFAANKGYRSTPYEITAHGVGNYAGHTTAEKAPPHVDATAATEFQILLDLARRNLPVPVKRADGSPEGGERAPTAEELEAASRPAFLTPKSGINRKISTKPGEIESAVLQGVTETPYNLLGMPVDLATMAMRPFGYDIKAPVGGSEWIKEKMTALGVRPEAPTQPTQRAFYELGQIGGGAVNPAAPVRGAVKAAEAVKESGKAAKALESMKNIPVGASIKPVEPIFQHLPTSEAPFVGRLDEFVAGLPGPVQKDQFLGQLRGKFREYDIKRAEETLADLPGNAKINPIDLLNRIKSKYDPSSFKTTVIPPKGQGEFHQSIDNPYASATDPDAGMLGVIHLSQHVNPDMAAKAKAVSDLNKSFDRLSGKTTMFIDSDIENINKALAGAAQGTTVPLSENARNTLVNFINKNNDLLSGASDIYEVEKRIRFPAAEPDYFSRMYKRAQELTGNKIPSDSALQKANAETIGQYFDEANQLLIKHGYEPFPKPNFKEMSSPATWMNEDRKTYDALVAKIKDVKNSFTTRMEALRPEAEQVGSIVRKDLQMTVPYKDQHSALMAPVDPVSFSRYSEHVADVPGMGKLEGIYVNELQSDRLDDIRKFGKRGGSSQADEKALDEIDNKLAEKFNKRYQAEAQGSTEAVAKLNDEIDGLSYRRARISKRIQEGEYAVSESFANMENLPQVAQQLMAKNAIMGAIQEGKQFVAFPGKESAQSQLYEKLPRNLKDVVKDLGPGFELREITLTDPDGLKMMHNAIVWGPEAAARIQKKGVPFKSGGMVERTYNDNRAYL